MHPYGLESDLSGDFGTEITCVAEAAIRVKCPSMVSTYQLQLTPLSGRHDRSGAMRTDVVKRSQHAVGTAVRKQL